MGGLVVYRLNLQHVLRDNVSWNRITIELQTGYFNNTFIDALLNTSSGAYDAYP